MQQGLGAADLVQQRNQPLMQPTRMHAVAVASADLVQQRNQPLMQPTHMHAVAVACLICRCPAHSVFVAARFTQRSSPLYLLSPMPAVQRVVAHGPHHIRGSIVAIDSAVPRQVCNRLPGLHAVCHTR